MPLRVKELYLEQDGPKMFIEGVGRRKDGGPFSLGQRAACNFVTRLLRRVDIESPNESRFLITGTTEPFPETRKRTRLLESEIYRDFDDYLLITDDIAKHEYMLAMIVEGMAKVEKFAGVPLRPFEEACEAFRAGGYVNRWVHLKHTLSDRKTRFQLEGEMTLEEVTFDFVTYIKDEEIRRERISRTMADECFYSEQFKKILVEDGQVTLSGRLGGARYDKICTYDRPADFPIILRPNQTVIGSLFYYIWSRPLETLMQANG